MINSLYTKVQMIHTGYFYFFFETKGRIINGGMSGNNIQVKDEF